jgi:hypothetical protein
MSGRDTNSLEEQHRAWLAKGYDTEISSTSVFSGNHIRNFDNVDGPYLRSIMPNQEVAIKTNILDRIEADCLRLMENKALAKCTYCKYTVKEIMLGLPPINVEETLLGLYERLRTRKGITAYMDKEIPNTLIICWGL